MSYGAPFVSRARLKAAARRNNSLGVYEGADLSLAYLTKTLRVASAVSLPADLRDFLSTG